MEYKIYEVNLFPRVVLTYRVRAKSSEDAFRIAQADARSDGEVDIRDSLFDSETIEIDSEEWDLDTEEKEE